MKLNDTSQKELELILAKFSTSIRANILKFRLGDWGLDLDDVLQEIRIKIWKTIADEKKVLHYSSYINRIINSTLIDLIRESRRADKLIHHQKQKWLQEKRSFEEASQDNILRESISEAVDSLIESRRKVVKLFLSDLTIEEISLSLNWSQDKTRNLLYRGLSDIKEKLREKGVEDEDRR